MRIISLKVFLLTMIVAMATACGNNSSQGSSSAIDVIDTGADATNDEDNKPDSMGNNAEYMNSLSTLVNEVSDGLNDIKDMERIVTTEDLNNSSEARKEQVRNDIILIKSSIQDRLNRLADLEEKVTRYEAESQFNKDEKNKMLNTIANLRQQLDEQQLMIDALTAKLNAAASTIKDLNERVDSLKTVNSNVTNESMMAKNEAEKAKDEVIQLSNELNECFYAIGTKNVLKAHKIIESGFFKKTKVMQSSSIMHSYFTKADKRTLNEIHLNSKKAKVLTNHDKHSYSIEDVNGLKVLKIYDQSLFWQYTNYLVVQTD